MRRARGRRLALASWLTALGALVIVGLHVAMPSSAEAQTIGRYPQVAALDGFFDDGAFGAAEHVIVGERDGTVHDVILSEGSVRDVVIARYSTAIVGVAAYDDPDIDDFNFIIVGLRDGTMHFLSTRDDAASTLDVALKPFSARLKALSGFRTGLEQHAIVALSDGSVRDLTYNPSTRSVSQVTLASYPVFPKGSGDFSVPAPPIGTKVTSIAGFQLNVDGFANVFVGLRNGSIRRIQYVRGQTPTNTRFARASSRVRSLAVFSDPATNASFELVAGRADGSLSWFETSDLFGLTVVTPLIPPQMSLHFITTAAYPSRRVPDTAPAISGWRFLTATREGDGLVSRHFFDGLGPAQP